MKTGFVGEKGLAVVRLPELADTEEAGKAVAHFHDLIENNAAGLPLGKFAPEIVAVDGAVGEPHSAMPVMVGNFVGVLLERKVARIWGAIGVEDRIQTGLGPAGENVVREMRTSNLDTNAVGLAGKADVRRGGGTGGGD